MLTAFCNCCWLVAKLCLTLRTYGLLPARFFCPWDFPGQNTGVGYHFLLQGIFLSQGSNLCLLCLAGRFSTTSTQGLPNTSKHKDHILKNKLWLQVGTQGQTSSLRPHFMGEKVLGPKSISWHSSPRLLGGDPHLICSAFSGLSPGLRA